MSLEADHKLTRKALLTAWKQDVLVKLIDAGFQQGETILDSVIPAIIISMACKHTKKGRNSTDKTLILFNILECTLAQN